MMDLLPGRDGAPLTALSGRPAGPALELAAWHGYFRRFRRLAITAVVTMSATTTRQASKCQGLMAYMVVTVPNHRKA